jgi:hypothetical protein
MLVGSRSLADKLVKAGIMLISQDEIVNGHRVFRFKVNPGQESIVERILRGKY